MDIPSATPAATERKLRGNLCDYPGQVAGNQPTQFVNRTERENDALVLQRSLVPLKSLRLRAVSIEGDWRSREVQCNVSACTSKFFDLFKSPRIGRTCRRTQSVPENAD